MVVIQPCCIDGRVEQLLRPARLTYVFSSQLRNTIMIRITGIRLVALAISFATLSAALHAQARIQDKDVLHARLAQFRGTPLPLSQIVTCDQEGTSYRNADLSIISRGPALILQGRDLANNTWKANLSITGLGCTIFQADLDDNGHLDLIIYAPGIGDRGSYDTSLTIILFDAQGKPFPWQATGRFTLGDGAIQEIRRDSEGVTILQTSEYGLPAWDGISYLSYLYRVQNSRVLSQRGSYGGIQFPYLVKANQTDTRIGRTAGEINLSTNGIAEHTVSPVQGTDPRFLEYGTDVASTSTTTSDSSLTSGAGQITNPTIDLKSLSNTEKQIVASDGSKLNLPDILVTDHSDGSRQIVFHPEEGDFEQLSGKNYRIHSVGSDCSSLDDCQPFIVWAK